MKLVTTALEWANARGEPNVSPKMLEAAAEALTLHRDAIRVIDAQPEASNKPSGA